MGTHASRSFFTSLLALLVVALTSGRAGAQGTAPRVVIWGAVGAASTGTGEVVTTYVPELKYFTIERGSGGQTVTLDASGRLVTSFGADAFFAPSFGLEAWVARDTLSPTGTSSTYNTSLRYVSRPPPSYDPVIVNYDRSDEWVPVSTDVHRWTTAVNGVVRWGADARVGGTVSGGLAFVHTSGAFDPLGYTMFVLGGHSTLFPNEYRLTAEMVPTTELRGNLGGTLDVRLASHAWLSFQLRQVLGPDTESTLRVTAVDRSAAGYDPPELDDITAQLSASTVTLPTASTKAMVGLKVGF